jgi:hypothetical protein
MVLKRFISSPQMVFVIVSNFIRGFGLQSKDSFTMHVIHGSFGSFGFALCGTTNAPANGWIKPKQEVENQHLYCSTCMLRIRLMYEDKDPRLTPSDREKFSKILRIVNARTPIKSSSTFTRTTDDDSGGNS